MMRELIWPTIGMQHEQQPPIIGIGKIGIGGGRMGGKMGGMQHWKMKRNYS